MATLVANSRDANDAAKACINEKVFSIQGNGLKLNDEKDVMVYVKALQNMPDVEEVKLGGNTLGVDACIALADVLKTKKSIKVIIFSDIFTSRLLSEIPPAISALLTAVSTLPNLHTIDLSDNAFGLNCHAPVSKFLSDHLPLEHLMLNNNGMGPKAGKYIAEALTELAHKKIDAQAPTLKTIVCGRNRLESGSMAAWAKMFAAHAKHANFMQSKQGNESCRDPGGIRVVRMIQNGIRQDGIKTVFTQGLSQLRHIEEIDFQDNTFTKSGARALASVIKYWPNLRILNVEDCLLKAEGGKCLAESLGSHEMGNHKLEVLRLQHNEIDAEGLKELTLAAKYRLPKLRRLELNGNCFEEDDANIKELEAIFKIRRSEFFQKIEQIEAELRKEAERDEYWGLDELDELDEKDSDEEDEDNEVEEEDTESDSDESQSKVEAEVTEKEKENTVNTCTQVDDSKSSAAINSITLNQAAQSGDDDSKATLDTNQNPSPRVGHETPSDKPNNEKPNSASHDNQVDKTKSTLMSKLISGLIGMFNKTEV